MLGHDYDLSFELQRKMGQDNPVPAKLLNGLRLHSPRRLDFWRRRLRRSADASVEQLFHDHFGTGMPFIRELADSAYESLEPGLYLLRFLNRRLLARFDHGEIAALVEQMKGLETEVNRQRRKNETQRQR